MAKISDRAAYPLASDQGTPIWQLEKSAAREAAKEMRTAFDVIAQKVGGF
jgi:chromosome partitioning protein